MVASTLSSSITWKPLRVRGRDASGRQTVESVTGYTPQWMSPAVVVFVLISEHALTVQIPVLGVAHWSTRAGG